MASSIDSSVYYKPVPSSSPPEKFAGSSEQGGDGYTTGVVGPAGHLGVYQDVWAAVVFIVHLLIVFGVAIALGASGFTFSQIENDLSAGAPVPDFDFAEAPSPASTEEPITFISWGPQLGAATVAAAVMSWLWLMLIKSFPVTMIIISLCWGVVVTFGLALVMVLTSGVGLAVPFIIVGVLNLIFVIWVRNRIPFSGAMLTQVVGVVSLFPSTIWVSVGGIVAVYVWVAVWAFSAGGALAVTNSSILSVIFLLSLYWTMEVIRNVVHVTCAGTVATYYFQRLNMPPNPTGKAFARATTTSFGSICFGSLIVAILQVLHTLVQSAQSNDNGNEILLSIVDCILGCLESLVQLFNKWAYIQVAVYGKSFMNAAKDTFELFKAQGIQLLINDDLTTSAFTFGCFLNALVSAVIGVLLTINQRVEITIVVGILAFIIGFSIMALMTSIIESGIAAYYVCYAEDPNTLQLNDPAFYQIITERRTLLMQ
eukprot:TRINITY_DN4141_c0_g1_i3.p1 TRINITY_DN4141_c0_g1~~TRINITY_DN4141_c0_g1_i3.p1  ORF type:complete len:496 (-),score=92.39 TRINITY_DN4141_c0_g1_i3:295-1743(-)